MRITKLILPTLPLLFVGVAQAEMVAVMSAKSSVASLTKQQVSDLFLGKATTFPDGGLAVPLDLAEGQAGRDDFHGKFTGKTGAQLKAYWSKQVFSGKGTPPKEVPSADEMKKLLAANPSMIGYLDRSIADTSLKVVVSP